MDFSRLTEFMDTICEEKGIPGAGIAVYYKHQPVYRHCVGLVDVENNTPTTPDTIYNLHSATKVSTATAAMQLVERGKMSLEDPLSKYIPEYEHMRVRQQLADGSTQLYPANNQITIRHLMTMAAGIQFDFSDPDFSEALSKIDPKYCTLDVVRAASRLPLLFEPGTHFKYTSCLDVMGAVIEQVSGQRFGDYLKENIFDPLGMKDTAFRMPEEKLGRIAMEYHGYDAATRTAQKANRPNGHRFEEFHSGSGGLLSTLDDYILLAEALCNYGLATTGQRILKPETIDLMRTDQMTGMQVKDIADFNGWYRAGYSYALGVRTMVNPGLTFSLSKKGEFGWDGMMGCYLLADPQSEVAIFYVQSEWGRPWWEWHAMLRNLVYGSLS